MTDVANLDELRDYDRRLRELLALPPTLDEVATPALRRVLARAAELGGAEVCVREFVLAAIEDPSSAAVLHHAGADVAAVARALRATVPVPSLSPPEGTRHTRNLDAVLAMAKHRNATSGLKQVRVGDVLAEMFRIADDAAVEIVRAAGVTRLAVMLYVSHGITEHAAPSAPPQARLIRSAPAKRAADAYYAIVLHDDRYTTLKFVVELLCLLFRMTTDEAETRARESQRNGSATVAICELDKALSYLAEAHDRARAAQFPLLLTVRPADE